MTKLNPTYTKGKLYEIPFGDLQADPNQPRKYFDSIALQDLVDSIKTHGLLTPILFRVDQEGNLFVVAGERRAAADMGQRFEKTAPDFSPGVKNPRRQDLVIGFDIERRESQTPAPAKSPADNAVNAVGSPQHASGGYDIPRRQLFTNERARNPFPIDHLRFHFHDFETEPGRFAL